MRLLQQRTLSLAILVVFVLSLAVPMVSAQDDDMMAHTCDSTTILLLFIAEYQYDYEPMMDVSTFEKGQYAPLFDAMMMDEDMMDEDMSDEDMSDEEMMDEDMSDDDMMDDMMMLSAPVIADEDPACTELRAEVEGWLYAHFEMGMMMMEDEG